MKKTPVRIELTENCFAGSRPAIEHQCRVVEMKSVPARNRTWSSTFAGSRANPPHSKDVIVNRLPHRGVAPRPAVSRAAILFITPAGLEADGRIRTRMIRFTRPAPFCFEPRRQLKAAMPQQRCEESNPVGQVWNLSALPGAHRCVRLPTPTLRPAATRVTHSVPCSSSSR